MLNLKNLPVDDPKLVVCGGGHIGIPVAKIGRMLGFRVTVLEDRPEFAENARAAGADEVILAPFDEGLARIPGDEDTFFVVVTRSHDLDNICLNAVCRKPHAYIGALGSRRRSALARERLVSEYGCDPETVASVHMPIGLPIGSETPEEIAVSVMAEIVQERNRTDRSGRWPRELLEALRDPDVKGSLALATVAERRGSAPRGVGTRMLIRPDGIAVGTVGGGELEAEVVQKALQMLSSGAPAETEVKAALNADGMACGGAVTVHIEIIPEEKRFEA